MCVDRISVFLKRITEYSLVWVMHRTILFANISEMELTLARHKLGKFLAHRERVLTRVWNY